MISLSLIYNRSLPFVAAVLICMGIALPARAQIRHEVFLPNTDHELHVYRILGEEPGNTLMIIGGIQGDEPGGYMTADLYADIHLKKGNLIVVPRANFYSILLNTRNGLTGDMNRKFTPEQGEGKRNLEEEVVTILKHLIAESDCLVNLHEGSGFYHPQWISAQENPLKFGQSLIYDASEYKLPGGNRVVNLEELGARIIERVNSQISNVRYQFKLNNHNTLSSKSMHKEQRRSATYYALTVGEIPAFGVETSKSIKSLATKISLHKLVVNSVMAELDITLDSPRVVVDPPKLEYLLVKVNDGYPYALPNGASIEIDAGDEVVVTDIIANYSRGMVADLEGIGNTNDTKKPFRIVKPTRIIVRKDSQKFGWVTVMPRQLYAQVGAPVPIVPQSQDIVPVTPAVVPQKETALVADHPPVAPSHTGSVTVSVEKGGEQAPVVVAALAPPSPAPRPVAPAPVVAAPAPPPVQQEIASTEPPAKQPVASLPAQPPLEITEDTVRAKALLITVNGSLQSLSDHDTLNVDRGAMLTLEGIKTNLSRVDKTVVVNFKGFTPPKKVNDGNDLSFPINTEKDLWEKYSVDQLGKKYPIVATLNDKVIGEFWIELR